MKKIVIVYAEKNQNAKMMADVLDANISQNDNIATVVWSDLQYKDNKVTTSSNQHIIFIGETETTKNIESSVNFNYDKGYMKYGWIGKKAIINVPNKKDFTKNDIDSFVELVNGTSNTKKKNNVFSDLNKKIEKLPKAAKIAGIAIGLPLFGAVGTAGAIVSGAYLMKDKVNAKKFNDDVCNYCVSHFMTNGLNKFIGTNNE